MKRYILISLIFIFLGFPAIAKDRFSNGPQMLSEGVEYVTLKSTVIRYIDYHLYIHPELLATLDNPAPGDAKTKAFTELKSIANKVCNANKSDICKVYLWDNLGYIPTPSSQYTNKELALAAGLYTLKSDGTTSLLWRKIAQ